MWSLFRPQCDIKQHSDEMQKKNEAIQRETELNKTEKKRSLNDSVSENKMKTRMQTWNSFPASLWNTRRTGAHLQFSSWYVVHWNRTPLLSLVFVSGDRKQACLRGPERAGRVLTLQKCSVTVNHAALCNPAVRTQSKDSRNSAITFPSAAAVWLTFFGENRDYRLKEYMKVWTGK